MNESAENTEVPQDLNELEVVVRAKERNHLLLASRPNVIGVDVGYRARAGETTNERVVKVYVSQKIDRQFLADDQLIPATVQVDDQEIPVDVEEGAIPRPGIFTLRSRPLRGGSSIGIDPERGAAGTLGVCVTLDDANTYILSCNHVIARTNAAAIGTDILQPAALDGGNPATDVIAALSNFVPIDFGTTTITILGQTITVPNPNFVDAALGRVDEAYNVGNREIHWIGYPHNFPSTPWSPLFRLTLIGRRVCKMGRTTEFTTGVIVSASFDTLVGPYGGGGAGGNAFFRNQLLIRGDGGRPFARPGDSGSLVLMIADAQPIGIPIGLVFAVAVGGDGDTVANPLDAVMGSALAIPRI